MKTIFCPSCSKECETNTESGEFSADGPAGTITGNLGDTEISDCCGEPVEEIDSGLFEYWLEIKKIAEEKDVEWFISDFPEDHRESFESGVLPEEAISSKLPF